MTGAASRTKVLWLAKGLGRGGAEQLLVTGAAHVDPDRFEVEVAYLLAWKDALVPSLRARGLPVHCLDQQSAMDVRWVLRLRALVRYGGFQIVHTHMPVPAVAARLALGPRRPRLVHTEHNVWERYRTATRWANAVTYRRNDAVLAVSDAVAASVPSRWVPASHPVEMLHHGIEAGAARHGAQARADARELLSLPDEATVIGTVANMTPKKDQRTLYQAVALLHGRYADLRLVHVGTGPLEPELRTFAAQLGIRVHFTGMRDDVPTLLPGFDVFALSSLHEGLSIALVEAMASGLPVVCTRVGGIPEVVTHGVEGLLVPPHRADALADALGALCADPDRRTAFALAARRRAADFDISRAVRRIEEVYDSVLVGR